MFRETKLNLFNGKTPPGNCEANFIYWKNLIGLLKIILFGGIAALSVIDELINSYFDDTQIYYLLIQHVRVVNSISLIVSETLDL